MLHTLIAPLLFSSQTDPLDVVRQAVNQPAFAAKEHWLIGGRAQYQGVPCTYSLKLSSGGRFKESILGRFQMVTGCDGSQTWEQDWNKTVRTLKLEDEESSEGIIGIVTPQWLDPNGPFEVKPIDPTLGTWDVKLKNKIWHAEVTVDVTTHRPKKVVYHGSDDDTVVNLSGALSDGGYWLPSLIKIEQAKQVNSINLTGAKSMPDYELSTFDKPALPQDTVFKTGSSKVEIKRLVSGHLAVHPLVNGKDVGWFIWDSGAGVTVINRKTADALNAPGMGRTPLSGIGGVEFGAYRRLKTFSVGPATFKDGLAVDLDLSPIASALGVKIAGIVGYDFMSRIVAEVDLRGPSLTISNPASYQLSSKGTWQDAIMEGRTPCVECQYQDGLSGPFRIDTGATGTVVLFGPVVREHNLLEGQKTTDVALAGVGGMVTVKSGTLNRFVLGGHVFENLTAMFATGTKGSFNDPYLHGNMGHDVLDSFRLVFDYTHGRIGFIPR